MPSGWVRKVVNRIVKIPAKSAAKHQPQPSQPAFPIGCQIRERWSSLTMLRIASRMSAKMKNKPITKTVMNVVSLVAKLSATQAPIHAGPVLARVVQEAPDRDQQRRA